MRQTARRHRTLKAAVRRRWSRFIASARPGARRRLRTLPPPLPTPEIDPVALTMLAVNRLGPAALRTATSGRALTVGVPDPRVARIFRAALLEMQKTRRTDRLVEIVVSEDSRPGGGGRNAAEA